MSIAFNHIIILKSLSLEERDTSDEVHRTIKYSLLKRSYPEMVEVMDVPDRVTFFAVLRGIKEFVKMGMKPLLHFEMHGAPDGLCLEHGEVITWEELKQPIREINILTKNNLFVSLATCYGGRFLSAYEPFNPCPFYGYVGPMNEMGERDLEHSFSDFFETLLETESVMEANYKIQQSSSVPTGQGRFAFINCDEYFERLTDMFKRTLDDPAEVKKWIAELMIKAKKNSPPVPDSVLESILYDQLVNKFPQTLSAWQRTFLHEEL